MARVNTTDRLSKLRELMKKEEIDIYIVPSEDSHQSEYIAPCDARRAFLSGFNGSAGTAVVTPSHAILATDGRYFNQAEHQLDSNWELLKQGVQGSITWFDWVLKQAENGHKIVGVDPEVFPAEAVPRYREKIEAKGGQLKPVYTNLVDVVWGSDRPARPQNDVIVLGPEFAGVSCAEKLSKLRKEIEEAKCRGFVVSALDEIAWLFNLRGSDIPYNPVFFSYAVVTADSASLYVDKSRIGHSVIKHLEGHVNIYPYDDLFDDINEIRLLNESDDDHKFLVSTQASWKLVEVLGGPKKVTSIRSPVASAKAIKNQVELDDQLVVAKNTINEVEAADKLQTLRAEGQHFMGLSFDTISSTGANAAIIHYSPVPESCAVIDPTKIYLCDSGGQYLDGTTDTTRTLHFGEPTEMEKKAYTLVLKGHIALDRVRFPKGTNGATLDIMARQHLWRYGLDYRHGTGHGVGSYLNVHEGPIGIGTRGIYSQVPLAEGHVLSNEPGYYEDGSFGVRIENVFMVQPVSTEHNFGGVSFFGFEHVTMVPMCRSLVDVNLLTADELKWLNAYHSEVLEKTKDLVVADPIAAQWLMKETAPL